MLRVGFVPLDDRPCTKDFPVRIGRIVGAEVHQPPTDSLGTFLTPGSFSEIRDWLLDTAGQIDYLIVSLDMLAYGGLIASRLPRVTQEEAIKRISILKEVKERYPKLPIFAWNVIMRTSITVYDDLTARYWEEMNRYSVLWAKEQQEMITPEEALVLSELRQSVPIEVQENYFAARRRNHAVNRTALELVKEGVIDCLSLTQEDAHPYGPHRLEQAELKKHISAQDWQTRVFLYPGADEGGLTLFARAVQDYYGCSCSAKIQFYPEHSQHHVAKFEDVSVGENVRLQTLAAGIGPADTVPNLWVAVMGPSSSVSGIDVWQRSDYSGGSDVDYDSLWESAMQASQAGLFPVILDVVQPNGSDPGLYASLKNKDLSVLASYAGWNTAGNTIGTGLAHGVVTAVGQSVGVLNINSHLEFLIERILDDYVYQRIVREELAQLIVENPQWGNRHHLTDEGWSELNQVVQEKLQNWADTQLTRFNLPKVKVNAHLPWPRIFEVSVITTIDGR